MLGAPVPPPVVAVIGAGTMGAAIAALLHDRGFAVTLLDLDHARLADALQRLRSADPPALDFPERAADLPRLALAEADPLLARADWVIEAIPERADFKASLYSRIAPFLGPGAILTTNTSALSIADLAAGLPPGLRSRFFGVHFFNPPRSLDLVETIAHDALLPTVRERVEAWIDGPLGKRIVRACDRPGFVANRIGIATMLEFMRTAERLRLSVVEADVAAGAALGRPRSGVFRLADRIGLDVLADLADDLARRLNEPDVFRLPDSVRALRERGWLGDKTGHGYTKREGKERFVFNPVTGAYLPQPAFPEVPPVRAIADLGAALKMPGAMGDLVRAALPVTLRYAESVAAEVAERPEDVDVALREGFGWRFGPLETLATFESRPPLPRLVDSRETPFAEYREIARRGRAVARDGGTATVLGWESKMGTLDPDLVADLRALLAETSGPVVLAGSEPHFSVGFDLSFFARIAATGDADGCDKALIDLQTLADELEARDSIAAIRGYALGGGFELALGCRRIVLAPDARVGLPESRLGLIPAGGGTTRMRMLHTHSGRAAAGAALLLTRGTYSDHAPHARALGYLGPIDRIATASRRTLHEALLLAGESLPPERWVPARPETGGMIDRFLVGPARERDLTDYDVRIGERLKAIMAKAKTKEEALAMERKHFLDLLTHPLTRARLAHMIEHKTPLRN